MVSEIGGNVLCLIHNLDAFIRVINAGYLNRVAKKLHIVLTMLIKRSNRLEDDTLFFMLE